MFNSDCMNKFLLFGASFAFVTIPAYASVFNEVTRLVSKSDLNKEAFAKKYKAAPHRVVSRVSGATVTLPWTENFDDESSFDNFTVIDANEDFAGWEYVDGKAEYCCLFADYDADDWLITPGFNMVAGKKYQISFRANTFDVASPEEFSAWLGNAPEADAMTISVVEKTTIAQDNSADYSVKVIVPADGVYYFGIHCTSPMEDAWTLDIDDISIKEAAAESAPAEVEDLTIVPDPLGELKATISFSAPTLAADGSELSALTKIEIYREDTKLIKTFDAPAPGDKLSYVDESPANGDNHYSVIAYNEVGAGSPALLSLFVGEDIPGAPQNLSQKIVDGDVVLTWEMDELGWNSHYINHDKLTYNLWDSADGFTLSEISKGIKAEDNSYTIEDRAEEGKQRQIIYCLQAETRTGTGSRAFSNTLIVGESLRLPYNETFADKKMSSRWFQSATDSKDVSALVEDDRNNDGGAMSISGHEKGCEISLFSSKIWIKDEPKLVLSFWYKSPADGALSAGLMKDFEVVKLNGLEPAGDWKFASFDLSDQTGIDYAQVTFRYAAGSEPCYIDDIELTATPLSLDSTVEQANVVARYNVAGQRVDEDYRGVVIERRSDGTVAKSIR